MPIYDFKCTKCENIFEVNCRYSELAESSSLTTCPKCFEPNAERHFSSQSNAIIPPDRLGRMKTPDGFKDVLHSIAERTPGAKGLHDRIR